MTTKGINIKLKDIEMDKNGRVFIKNKQLSEKIKQQISRGLSNVSRCDTHVVVGFACGEQKKKKKQ